MSLGFRRLLSWWAILTFAGTFGVGAGTFGHNGLDDDAACRQAVQTSGHARVQFETATTSPAPSHCAFCHWQRTVGGGSILSTDVSVAKLDLIDVAVTLTARAIGSAALDERPSRAPPALLG